MTPLDFERASVFLETLVRREGSDLPRRDRTDCFLLQVVLGAAVLCAGSPPQAVLFNKGLYQGAGLLAHS